MFEIFLCLKPKNKLDQNIYSECLYQAFERLSVRMNDEAQTSPSNEETHLSTYQFIW